MSEVTEAQDVLLGFLLAFEAELDKGVSEKDRLFHQDLVMAVGAKIFQATTMEELVVVHKEIHEIGGSIWKARMRTHLSRTAVPRAGVEPAKTGF